MRLKIELSAQPKKVSSYNGFVRYVRVPSPVPSNLKAPSLLLLLWIFAFSAVSQVRLVADLNPVKKDPVEFKPFSHHENDGGRSFFIGLTNELWTSDGSTIGTKFLKEFQVIQELEVIGNICYFSAGTMEHGIELWRSNGTAAGTVKVKDIYPGQGSSSPSSLIEMKGELYFSANNKVNGRELWKSDGTEEGTKLVYDIRPGASGSMPKDLVSDSTRVFFIATTEGIGYELWISDGTSSGSKPVKDINPGQAGSDITNLTPLNGIVYFSAQSPRRGRQLWRSDGTEKGTSIVAVINTAGSALVSNLTRVNDLIFFKATDAIYGEGLFRSDGTPKGTFMILDTNALLTSFSKIGTKLFFVSYNDEWDTRDRTIWMSDGTEEGTVPFSSPGLYVSIGHHFQEINGEAYMLGSNRSLEQQGLFRFKNDGNVSLVEKTEWREEEPLRFVRMGELYFAPVYGNYLRSNGTPSGTFPLRLLCCGGGSRPSHLTDADGTLYFSIVNGEQFWRTQGTEETTELVEEDFVEEIETLNRDVYYRLGDSFGPGSSVWKLSGETGNRTELSGVATDPRVITATDDKVFFIADTPSGERKLWVSDGTPEGTHVISASPEPNFMKALGSKVIFDVGFDRWVSDGTEAGTFKLVTLRNVQYRSQFKDELYFFASDATHGLELWKTNGTPTGTVIVSDVRENDLSGLPSVDLGTVAISQDWLYFSGLNHENKPAIWRTDGTESGTTQLADFDDGSAQPPLLFSAGTTILVVRGLNDESELLRIDGDNLRSVKRVDESFNNQYAVKGNVVYTITNPTNSSTDANKHIWRSDGTHEGTYRIKFHGNPNLLATSGDFVYVSGRTDKEGDELFVIEESIQSSNAPKYNATVGRSVHSEEIVNVFPSPFSDGFTLHVSGEDNTSFHVEMLTLNGQLIEKARFSHNAQHYVAATGWSDGLYLMKIMTANGTSIRKMVKYSR